MVKLNFDATAIAPAQRRTDQDVAREVFDCALDDVRSAARGTRNNTLNAAAFTCGRIVGADLVSWDEAFQQLADAAAFAGIPVWEASRTIKSGLTGGAAQPWELRDAAAPTPLPARPRPLSSSPAAIRAQADREVKNEIARTVYERALPTIGTRGEEYLKSRGIEITPEAVRFSGAYNGLAIPLTTPAGEVVAIQKIPVRPDGKRGEKQTNGQMFNAMFVLPASEPGPSVVVDGPEDAMSAHQASGWRVFGACGKGRFRHVADHLASGDGVIVVRDRDGTDSSEYDTAVAAFQEKGIDVVFADPPDPHKDVNALTVAEGNRTVRAWLEEAAAEFEKPPAERTVPVQSLPSAPAERRGRISTFPKELLRPGGTLEMLVEHIVSTARYPQPELSLAASLTLLGSLMGRRVKGPSGLRTNLYTIGVADSGAGKGHPRERCKTILQELRQHHILGGDRISSGAGLITRLRLQPNTFYALDEFGMFLQSAYDMKAAKHVTEVVALFTQFFSEAGQIWMGSDYADRRANPNEPIVQPHLSIYGITNPNSLWNAFGSGAMKDGSLARYLVFFPRNMYPDRNRAQAGDAVPNLLLDRLHAIVNDVPEPQERGNLAGVSQGDPRPLPVPADPAAQALLDQYEDAMVEERRKALGTGRATAIARAVEHAYKVACILAVADQPTAPLITEGHARYGTALATHCTDWIMGQAELHIADTEFGRKMIKVREVIQQTGTKGITRSELTRKTSHMLSGNFERNQILGELTEGRFVAFAEIKESRKPSVKYWSAEMAPSYAQREVEEGE